MGQEHIVLWREDFLGRFWPMYSRVVTVHTLQARGVCMQTLRYAHHPSSRDHFICRSYDNMTTSRESFSARAPMLLNGGMQ